MSFHDILSQRKLTHVSISPGGVYVAVVVTEANLATNRNNISLHVVPTHRGSATRQLVSTVHTEYRTEAITNVRWRPGHRTLTYLTRRDNRIVLAEWSIERDAERIPAGSTNKDIGRDRLIRERRLPSGTETFEWSPDGQSIAILRRLERIEIPDSVPRLYGGVYPRYAISGPVKTVQNIIDVHGIDDLDSSLTGDRTNTRFRVFETQSGPISLPPETTIQHFQWSPNGEAIAISVIAYNNAVDVGRTIIVSIPKKDDKYGSIQGAGTCAVVDGYGFRAWISNNSLALVNYEGLSNNVFKITRPPRMLYVMVTSNETEPATLRLLAELTLTQGSVGNAWVGADGNLLFEASGRLTNTLYRLRVDDPVSAHRPVVTEDVRISDCDVDSTGGWAACILESPNLPPEVASIDLKTGEVRTLTKFNAHLARLRLADVKRIHVQDARGDSVTMYLIYPLDHRPNQRHPAIVLLYGFSNQFISQASYITSYPAQVFAARGYVTLLWNYPELHGGPVGDLLAQSFDLRDNPVKTIRAAVDTLVSQGLADPDRIGIAGHSMGAIWTSYALDDTVSGTAQLFKAAAIHNPGSYNALNYWLSGARWRRRLDLIFGGPPGGPSDSVWKKLDMYRLRPPRSIPLLREYAGANDEFMGNLDGSYWQEVGLPIETWVYPYESHNFFRPRTRLSSMQLNAEWFDFWLRNVEDPAPEKAEQYRRWRAMGNVAQ